MKKRNLLLIFCSIICLLLTGCAGSGTGNLSELSELSSKNTEDKKQTEGELYADTYTCIGLYLDGQYLSYDYCDSWTTTLDTDGSGSLDWGEDNRGPISDWSIDNGKLLIKAGISDIEGSITNGVMVLDLGDGFTVAMIGQDVDPDTLNIIPLDDYLSEHPEALAETENPDAIPEADNPDAAAETENSNAVPEAYNSEKIYTYTPERYKTDTLTWEFDADTGSLFIHGEGPMRDYSDTTPEWEQYKDDILVIILDEGITSVGAYAFFDYGSLTEVRLPDSVTEIGESAFDYAWELRTITIPTSLKYVGDRAFYNTLLHTPEDLIFPEGCEYIGDSAFHSALKTGGIVSFPSTLKYLGAQSFTNSYISDFTISEDNETYCVENHAVYTKDMKEMRMLAQVPEGIAEFRIPDGVERISAECFNVIQAIETVYIPSSVTEIPEGAFFSNYDLKEIIVDEANRNYKSENGLLLSKDGTLLLAWPDAMESSEIVIPDGVERIGTYLLYGRFDKSYTVVLPESVKEIGTLSLPWDVTSLTLPSSLEKIDAYVFPDTYSIDDIYYNGTEADWGKIVIEDGNTGLDNVVIHTN